MNELLMNKGFLKTENPNEYAVVKLMPAVYDAVQAVVEEKMSAFRSAGKAVV